MNIRSMYLKLRNWLVSPLVVGICKSLKHDSENWTYEDADCGYGEYNVKHNSGRFYICCWNGKDFYISNEHGKNIIQLGIFEDFLLSRSVKSFVTTYSAEEINKVIHSLRTSL